MEELLIKLQPLSDSFGSGDVNSDIAILLLLIAGLFTIIVFAVVFLFGNSGNRHVEPQGAEVDSGAMSQLTGMRRELQNDIERLKGEARYLREELRSIREASVQLQENLERGQEQLRIMSLAQSAERNLAAANDDRRASNGNRSQRAPSGGTRATVALRGTSYGSRR